MELQGSDNDLDVFTPSNKSDRQQTCHSIYHALQSHGKNYTEMLNYDK